eukprot:1316824-Amphidinium_carterae.1
MGVCCMACLVEVSCTLVGDGCCTLVIDETRVELIALLVVLVESVCVVEEVAVVEIVLCCWVLGGLVACGFVFGVDECCTLVSGNDCESVDLDEALVVLIALLVVHVEDTLVDGDLCALAVLVGSCCRTLVSDGDLDVDNLADGYVELIALLVVHVAKACVVGEVAMASTRTSSLPTRPLCPVVLLQDDGRLLRLSAAWHAVIVAPIDTSLSDNDTSMAVIEAASRTGANVRPQQRGASGRCWRCASWPLLAQTKLSRGKSLACELKHLNYLRAARKVTAKTLEGTNAVATEIITIAIPKD